MVWRSQGGDREGECADGDEFHLNSAFRGIIMWPFFFIPVIFCMLRVDKGYTEEEKNPIGVVLMTFFFKKKNGCKKP